MKPATITNENARKFPVVDFQYQVSSLEDLNSRCATLSNSFRDISRDYFESEENQDFVSNAAIFGALIASALVPIIAGVNAVIHLCSALPRI